MVRKHGTIRLTEEERNILAEWSSKGTDESQSVERARIILLSAEEHTVEEIARRLNTRPARVSKWRQRFLKHRLFGLSDFQRSGAPGKYDDQTEKRILGLLEEAPPDGHAQWNGRLLAAALGDVSQAQVWRILRRREVQLARRRSWSIRTDAEFSPKATDIVGLYLDPPESALVLCVDEASLVQSRDGGEGFVRLTSGKAAKNFTRGERTSGAITLSEALKVMTEQLGAGHVQRRCHRRFLDFMNDVLSARPRQEIHVVLNHPSGHKPQWDRWLRKHPWTRLHFTPTYTSWLNQIECWFSILGGAALSSTSFTQPRQLREAIEAFVGAHHEHTTPFEWTKIPAAPGRCDEAYGSPLTGLTV